MVVTPIVLPRKCETCMMNRLTRFLKLAGFDAHGDRVKKYVTNR